MSAQNPVLRSVVEFLVQFVYTSIHYQRAFNFIKKHRLWRGVLAYGWVSYVLIGTALLLGLKFLSIITDWWRQGNAGDPLTTMSSLGNTFQTMALESYQLLFFGGMKYIMLILLEVIVFHFCRKTLEVLTGEKGDLRFDTFLRAQVRMIKVSARSWIMETLASIFIGIVLGLLGFLEFLEPVLIFGVQCYYLGFALIDNYNEQFGLTIKQSAAYTRGYLGVALSAGLTLTLLMYIPVAGPILAPVLVAVAITLVMYELADLRLDPIAPAEPNATKNEPDQLPL